MSKIKEKYIDGSGGTNTQVLTTDGTDASWQDASGGGTVTSVAVSGSDGIEIDSGSPITSSGTIALGVNKTTMLSTLNVEDGADVTDTTNVTAAGALMDTEVDADIKTLVLPASTTISTFGASLVDDAAAINARSTLDVDQAGTDNSTDVTLNASATTGGLSLSTQELSNQAATNAQNGYMTSTLVGNIETNNAKNTNVSTALSQGTRAATTYGITSDGGANDIILPEATTSLSGVLSSTKFNEIVANTNKATNVSTNLSEGTSTTTTVAVNSSDGTNATLASASTSRAGLLTKAKFDEIVVNTNKTTNQTHTGEVTGATALTIADNIVDEANMKISNAPTNDQVLTADSAVTGGWKWAGVSADLTSVVDGTTIEYKDINETTSTKKLTIGDLIIKKLAEGELRATVLEANASLTGATTSLEDIMSDADGLLNTVTTATTTSVYDVTNKLYKNPTVTETEVTTLVTGTNQNREFVGFSSKKEVIFSKLKYVAKNGGTGTIKFYKNGQTLSLAYYTYPSATYVSGTTYEIDLNIPLAINDTIYIEHEVDASFEISTITSYTTNDYISDYSSFKLSTKSGNSLSFKEIDETEPLEKVISLTYNKSNPTALYFMPYSSSTGVADVGDVTIKLYKDATLLGTYDAFTLYNGLTLAETPNKAVITQADTSLSKIYQYVLLIE